jgi:hypothetical protein
MEAIKAAAEALINLPGFTGVVMYETGEQNEQGHAGCAVCYPDAMDPERVMEMFSSYVLGKVDAELDAQDAASCDATMGREG